MSPGSLLPPYAYLSRHAGILAATLCATTGAAAATALDGYSHAQYPLAVLGARAVPHALPFNLLAFVLPGLLVAWGMLHLRAALPAAARWPARIGAQMALLSALAFAVQGLLPLDLGDLDGPASRLHAAAWMAWWIAFAGGGALLASGLARRPAWGWLATATLLAATLVPACALFVALLLPAGIAQRLAFALWFAWAIAAGMAVSRAAASAPGSSPTAPG